jgi:hypothetical protein
MSKQRNDWSLGTSSDTASVDAGEAYALTYFTPKLFTRKL